ncbi:hypothetical protein Glove_399g40 [Diversispora epigaea]|uniref:Uncharacterized protein n=1 Tax=Diversispora epigaea TaxID=1348612 RepID=A0A397H8A6_9GLOM|nr:hypothetical protein Glove_399g40 [Diversispora epigaea]
MYSQISQHNLLSNNGHIAYSQFQEVYRLGDSEEQSILSLENEQFSDTIYIFSWKVNVEEFNIDKFKSLNYFIARNNSIYTGGNEARKSDSDITKSLDAQLLLARVFEENQDPSSLPAVLIEFGNYTGPAITTAEELSQDQISFDNMYNQFHLEDKLGKGQKELACECKSLLFSHGQSLFIKARG